MKWLNVLAGLAVALVVAAVAGHGNVPAKPATGWCVQVQIPGKVL